MEHNFNVKIAEKYGLEEAILIHNIRFWVLKNKANNRHFHDGRYWTYNSVKAFSELFPYFSARQIERILKSCIEQGALLKGNYNSTNYDRTSWYAFTQTVECIYANGEMDSRKQGNRFTETGEPIPDNNTDSKQNKKPYNLEKDDFPDFPKPQDFPDGVENSEKPKTKYDLIKIQNIEMCSEVLKDISWVEDFSMKNKIYNNGRHSNFRIILLEFTSELSLSYKTHKTKSEFKMHFSNWAKLKKPEELTAIVRKFEQKVREEREGNKSTAKKSSIVL